MGKEELKPIDVSKYTVTESGNVIKSEELKSERIEALRERLRTELNEWWKKTFDVKREDDVCQVIKTKEAEDLCFDIALPREMQIDILSQHILELEADKGKLTDKVRELEQQIKKLIDFVLSKTECCDVCPITDTCINDEGTCPYVGILAKSEEEVTREWLMQFILRR